MSDEVLEQYIKQYIAGVTGSEVVFSWQGGEPTLLGLDFFRKVVALEKKHAKPFQVIQNDLQTNGTLLNDEWAAFLKENRFLVGLSIDGPREIHDKYRVTKGRKPTFEKVFAAAKLLKRHGVPFNTLTCINRFNVRKPLDVYRFLRSEVGSTYLQFIPIVEYKGFERVAPQRWDLSKLPKDGDPQARPGHPDSIVTDWSVDPDDWGYFLCKVFDEWRNRDIGKLSVNHFETRWCRSTWAWARRFAFTANSAARVWRWKTTGAFMRATITFIRIIASAISRRGNWRTWFFHADR
jgi:uncharacterized protein